MLPETFAPRVEHLGSLWGEIDALDFGPYEGGAPLNASAVAKLTSAAKALVSTHLDDDKTITAEENVRRLLKVAKVMQYAYEFQQYQSEEIESDLEKKVDTLAEDLQDAEAECDTLRSQLERNNQEDIDTTNQKIELVLNELDEERIKNDRFERQVKQLESDVERGRESTRVAQDARAKAESRLSEVEDRLQSAEEDLAELRAHLATEQKRAVVRGDDDKVLNSRLIKYTREIDRLQRENDMLAETNAKVQSKSAELQSELIDVSESLVEVDNANRERELTISKLEDSCQELELERDNMSLRITELEESVTEKVSLLEQFEVRFKQQYTSWVAERKKLSSDIQSRQTTKRLEDSLMGPAGRGRGSPTSDVSEGSEGDRESDFVASQEQVALLLEAYEQLEKDTAREVDHALQIQRSKLDRFESEIKIKDEALEIERERFRQLDQALAEAQRMLEEAELTNKDYEAGIYGLPEAVTEIKGLKQEKRSMDVKMKDALKKYANISQEAQDLLEENALLRRKLGLPEDEKIEIKDVRLQSQVAVAQLRAINAQLQREIMELEDDRRRMKMEMRFRAKWQGEHALHMGLSPNQLLLLEEYADSLRYGGGSSAPESKLVGDMERQIRALEERLALVQVSPNHPDASTDVYMAQGDGESVHRESLLNQNLQSVVSTLKGRNAELSQEVQHYHIQTAQLISELEAMSDASNQEVSRSLGQVHAKLQAMLTSAASSAMAATPAKAESQQAIQSRLNVLQQELEIKQAEGQSKDLLIESLQRELAQAVAVTRAMADAAAPRMQGQSQELAAGSPAPASASPIPLTPAQAHAQAQAQAAAMEGVLDVASSSLFKQLAQCLTVQGKHSDEMKQLVTELLGYKSKLQGFADQRALLYREYFFAEQRWKKERDAMRSRMEELEAECSEQKIRIIEVDKLNQALKSTDESEVKQELRKIVGKSAVLQVKAMRLQRRLDVVSTSEHAVKDENLQLLDDIQQLSTSFRAEIRQLQYAKRMCEVTLHKVYREVESSVPARLFNEVLAQKIALQEGMKRVTEHNATRAVEASKMATLQRKAKDLESALDKAKDDHTLLEERAKELESALGAAQADGGAGAASYDEDVRSEVVALRAALKSATRKSDMNAKARQRFDETEKELRTSIEELEAALQKKTRLLHSARKSETDLTKTISGMVQKDVYANLQENYMACEKELVDLRRQVAEFGDMKATHSEEAKRFETFQSVYRQDISSLKGALRHMADSTDHTHAINRLHEELLHLRAKEAAMKMSLARAESRSQKLEQQCEDLNNKVQDTLRDLWAERESAKTKFRHQNNMFDRLETELAGSVEFYKADKWAKTVEQLQSSTQELLQKVKEKEERQVATELELENAKISLQGGLDIQRYMNEAPSDVHRQIIRLQEDYLQSKMTSSRLQREVDGLMGRAKLNEKSASASETQLQRIEEDSLRQQMSLKEQIRLLQANESELEQKVLSLQKEKEEIQASADVSSRLTRRENLNDEYGSALLRTQVEGGQSIILEQIDKIRDLRKEVVTLEEKASRTQRELEGKTSELRDVEIERDHLLNRIESQLQSIKGGTSKVDDDGAAIEQVKAAAEASVKRLQSIVDGKNAKIKELRAELDKERKASLEQTLHNNEKIHKLRSSAEQAKNSSAFIRAINTKAADQSRNKMSVGGNKENKYSALSYDQLLDLIEERDHNIELLRNKIEQSDAKFEIMQTRLSEDLRTAEQSLQRLSVEMDKEKAKGTSKVMAITVARLKSQLSSKDKRLLQLKDAIKALEGQLAKVMQASASHTILESDVQLAIQEQGLIKQAVEAKLNTEARLGKAHEELRKLKGIIDKKNESILRLESQNTRLVKQTREPGLYEEESAALLAPEPAMDLTDPEQMKKRIRVLESRNHRLKIMLQATEGMQKAAKKAKTKKAKGAEGDKADATPASAPASAVEAATPQPAAPSPPREAGTEEEQELSPSDKLVMVSVTTPERKPKASASKAKVSAKKTAPSTPASLELTKWEEGKKLKKQIELQKGKVAKLQTKVDALERELQRHRNVTENLTSERTKLAARMREQQKELDAYRGVGLPEKRKPLRAKAAETTALEYQTKIHGLEKEVLLMSDAVDAMRLERDKLAHKVEQRRGAQDADAATAADADGAGAGAGAGAGTGGAAGAESTEDWQEQLFDMTLERDQAMAKADKYKAKLANYFDNIDRVGAEAIPEAATFAPGSAKIAKLQAENEDLKGLIGGFKRSIAKLRHDSEHSVSNQKYVAALQRIKELKRTVEKLQTELNTTDKRHLNAIKHSEGKINDLSMSVAKLRKQLANKVAVEESNAVLEEQLELREADIGRLEVECDEQRDRLAVLESRAEGAMVDETFVKELQEEVEELKLKAREYALENRDLKNELNAFDPAFFEEIESMKWELAEAKKRVQELEAI